MMACRWQTHERNLIRSQLEWEILFHSVLAFPGHHQLAATRHTWGGRSRGKPEENAVVKRKALRHVNTAFAVNQMRRVLEIPSRSRHTEGNVAWKSD